MQPFDFGGPRGGFQDPRLNRGGPGNPRGINNVPRGGQRQDMGRYRPPTMRFDGQWDDSGGYSYNLPNSFGPSRDFGEFRRPQFQGGPQRGFDPRMLQQLGQAGGNFGRPQFSQRYGGMGAEFKQPQYAPKPMEEQQPSSDLASLLGIGPRPSFNRAPQRFPMNSGGFGYEYTQPVYDAGY